MLTSEQAFCAGFLLKCAEDGLSKEAMAHKISMAKVAWPSLGGLISGAVTVPLATGALGGTLVGGGLGMLHNSHEELNPEKPPEIKQIHDIELASALRQSAIQLRRQAASIRRKQKQSRIGGRW